MKKVLLLYFLVCFMQLAHAQNDTTVSTMTFGIRGGAIFYSLQTYDFPSYQLSYQLGVTGQFQLTGKHYIQAEFLFSNMKYKPFRNYYLLVPVLYKADLNPGFSIEAGPQINLNLFNDFGVRVFNTPDVGFCVGISRSLGYNNSINLRYSRGLTPVFENKDLRASVLAVTIINEF